ncbi:DUF4838 domain-containing protein, partial [bacterium]|nr:DUF4838 domain-containing protein [bacterium]
VLLLLVACATPKPNGAAAPANQAPAGGGAVVTLQPLPPTDTVGQPGSGDLVIADQGATKAIVVVAEAAGPREKQAAADLVKYIELMSGAQPALANTGTQITDALKRGGDHPLIIVGALALKELPALQQRLDKAAKKNPALRADAIVIKRQGNRVYVAGTNDEAHYYAAAKLLREWGCRWFLPSEFGECIPEQPTLKVGRIDYAYGTPFEVRGYWISWNGEQKGRKEFSLRNMMNDVCVGGGHSLGQYVKEVIPPGKTMMNIPIAEDQTADAVANHPEAIRKFAAGEDFSLGMEDGLYQSDSQLDAELRAGLTDKYFLSSTLTDNFLVFYNKVCARLLAKYPQSRSHIGFLAYSNITIPPQRAITAAKPLVMSLAPIDIDPNHAMTDPRSPPKGEYREMMRRWSQVMEGRMFIYDYDQGMLVWRDIPNPIAPWIGTDIREYARAGILGVNTECRNAIATVFLNLYLRGQLLWDPQAEVSDLLADFYPRFYGPAAEPMADYWNALHQAWADTLVTEHEHLVIPAIYTPELVAELRQHLGAAEAKMKDLAARPGDQPRDWKKFEERMQFTRLSFNLIAQYTGAGRAAAREVDYAKAAAQGDQAIATRLELGNLNTTFTTRIIPTMPVPETKNNGPAWLMGEIEQYRKLGQLTDGTRGTLVAKLPIEWAFRRDPHDTGVASGFAYNPVDLAYWNQHGQEFTPERRKDYPTTEWEMLRTDLYAQAQGVLHPDWQSFTGHLWYRTSVDLTKNQAAPGKKLHIMFPGLFNEAWLYVNGHLVAYRPFSKLWWLSDYTFEWDVDLTGQVKPGENAITVRLNNPHHFGGMFRRPFLYEAK